MRLRRAVRLSEIICSVSGQREMRAALRNFDGCLDADQATLVVRDGARERFRFFGEAIEFFTDEEDFFGCGESIREQAQARASFIAWIFCKFSCISERAERIEASAPSSAVFISPKSAASASFSESDVCCS